MKIRGSRPRDTSTMALIVATALVGGCNAESAQGPSTLPPGVVSLMPGQSAVVERATTLEIDVGSQATENVLVLADTATTAISARLSYQVASTNIGAPGAVSAASPSLSPLGSLLPSLRPAGPVLDIAFGARLNERARARLRPGFRAARTAYSSRVAAGGPSRSRVAAEPRVGDVINVNVGTRACDSVISRRARVAAIGTRSIILSDTQNPAGGFTDVEYQRFAARFDTLVYPLNVANFGAPVDIDQNQKVLLLFTTAVNELTPRNSDSYVAGFFFDRDLFPVAASPDFPGCEGSNFGELFYLLAPDPAGSVNGNIRRTGFVDSVTTAVIAHEFQHLINASRRLFVTQGAEDFEEVWLNEGLSHIAEELLFYHEADITPRRNLDAPQLRSNGEIRSAYNADMASNTGRYQSYLLAPSENSPLRDDDSLETRGAAWSLLRYAADHKVGASGSEASVWQALVNSPLVGVPNFNRVFGPGVGALLRDWMIANYTDDLVPGLTPRHTHPSWNFRSIYSALSGSGNSYPLKVLPLSTSGASGTLIGGSAAYYRFSIPANTRATITVTAPALIEARVIRIR